MDFIHEPNGHAIAGVQGATAWLLLTDPDGRSGKPMPFQVSYEL